MATLRCAGCCHIHRASSRRHCSLRSRRAYPPADSLLLNPCGFLTLAGGLPVTGALIGRGATALTPGGVRLLNGVFPLARSRRRRFRLRPRSLEDRLSLPCGEESRSSPRRVDCALRRRLPTRVEGPSGVEPPVRLRRRTLACPVLPLRALAPASTGLATDCDVSLGFHFHCWLWDPMKPRGIFLRLCPPAKQIDHEWFSLPGEPQPRLLPVVRPRPTYHLSMT